MAQLFERSQVGKREDLADYISLVDAKDTPFVSMAPKGSKPGNTLFQWQADNYDAAVTTGTVDGTDVSAYSNLNANRKIIQNYIQIFRRTVRVSPLSVNVSIVAGLKDELAGMVAKGITLLKRDMEATFLSTNDMQVDNGTNPYLTRGLGSWISSSAQSLNPVDTLYRTDAGAINTTATQANMSEANIQDILTAIWGKTGVQRDYDCFVGSSLKRAFTNLLFTSSTVNVQSTNTGVAATAIRTFNRAADAETYMSSVDVFQGDFGTLRLHPDAFMPSALTGYVVPIDLTEIRYSNLPSVTELPNAGGGPIRLIEAVAGLVVKNPSAFGKIVLAS